MYKIGMQNPIATISEITLKKKPFRFQFKERNNLFKLKKDYPISHYIIALQLEFIKKYNVYGLYVRFNQYIVVKQIMVWFSFVQCRNSANCLLLPHQDKRFNLHIYSLSICFPPSILPGGPCGPVRPKETVALYEV